MIKALGKLGLKGAGMIAAVLFTFVVATYITLNLGTIKAATVPAPTAAPTVIQAVQSAPQRADGNGTGPTSTPTAAPAATATTAPAPTQAPTAAPAKPAAVTASRVQPIGWCSLPDNPPRQESLNWDGSMRVWMQDHLAQTIKQLGGHCELDFGQPTAFELDSIAGTIKIDGRDVKQGNRIPLAGLRLVIDYNPGVISNGFDVWIPARPTTVDSDQGAAKLPVSGALSGFCTVSGAQQQLLYDGRLRIWMDRPLVESIQKTGGHCEANLGGKTFTLNSVEGNISFDGKKIVNDNGLLLTGSSLIIDYVANNDSNGFDIWFIGAPASGSVSAASQPTSASTPAAASGSTGSTANAGAVGSCTVNGQEMQLAWDPGKARLWMPWFQDAKTANATQPISCKMEAKTNGTMEALGQSIDQVPGTKWEYTFPARDASFGFAWQQKK